MGLYLARKPLTSEGSAAAGTSWSQSQELWLCAPAGGLS